MMLSERVRSALCEDLKDMVRGLERMGLWVRVGDQVGRIQEKDLRIEEADHNHAGAWHEVPVESPTRRVARKAQASAPVKASRLALPAPAGAHGVCDVCGEALKPHGKRKEILCGKHAGRWYQVVHWAKKNGNPKPDYRAWVDRQKAGGGRAKKV